MGQTDPTGLLYQGVMEKHLKKLMEKKKKQKIDQKEIEVPYPLYDYFDSPLAHIPDDQENLRINMKVFDQRSLVNQLCDLVESDITYLDRPVIQKIIQYKWKDHAYSTYRQHFYMILVFAFSYLSNLMIGPINDSNTLIACICTQTIGVIATLLMVRWEIT